MLKRIYRQAKAYNIPPSEDLLGLSRNTKSKAIKAIRSKTQKILPHGDVLGLSRHTKSRAKANLQASQSLQYTTSRGFTRLKSKHKVQSEPVAGAWDRSLGGTNRKDKSAVFPCFGKPPNKGVANVSRLAPPCSCSCPARSSC